MQLSVSDACVYFYPRSPCGERPCRKTAATERPSISIHALLAESDWEHTTPPPGAWNFYPRSPCGERRLNGKAARTYYAFLSTLSLRRATLCTPIPQIYPVISIHALLAESDLTSASISTRSWTFLSTLSLRRATVQVRHQRHAGRHFYPRSPCGERQGLRPLDVGHVPISIHALLAESDCGLPYNIIKTPRISIHALLAESDFLNDAGAAHGLISIHALLAESDGAAGGSALRSCKDFYPRSPCGERPHKSTKSNKAHEFLSTLSLRRATRVVRRNALHELFLSTLSLRRATTGLRGHKVKLAISIHALLAESDAAGRLSVILII